MLKSEVIMFKNLLVRYGFRKKAAGLLIAVLVVCTANLYAGPNPPAGADAVPDLFSAGLAGAGGFTTTTGGAPVSAINPAQGGTANRMIFDLGYLAIPSFSNSEGNKDGFMQSLQLGALFPTRYGVFGSSLRYIGGFEEGQFESFPIEPTFSGNIFAAKEIYPGMSLGLGINFGFGFDSTFSADFGFHYNSGDVGPFRNFTYGVVLRSMGKSYFPTWLTLAGGVSFDILRIEGEEGKPDPFVLNSATDLSFPSLFYPDNISMIFKTGFKMTFAELITLSIAWPGGSGLNMRELSNGVELPFIPSIGLGVNIILPSGGERIAGGRLPSDGDLKIDTGFKPLYGGVTAIGAGISWYVGMTDNRPPVIEIDYPETMHISPNNDGKADYLEFPISITDDNYVVSWVFEIKDEHNNIVRTIENKEQRFASFNIRDILSRLFSEKKHIEIPSTLRWDGLRNTGEVAADGRYFFTITATDDSDNVATSDVFEVVVRNTPPTINIDPMTEAQLIFDPTGRSGNSAVTFTPRGSDEEMWESGIYNLNDERIRTFETESGIPSRRIWDGKDDTGQNAPDGVYTYRISVTDRALNSASAEMNNIILDSREAGAFLTSSVSGIAPRAGQTEGLVDFAIRLLTNDGIENWKLELRDETGVIHRTFSGTVDIPAIISWDGLGEERQIREGTYTPLLTINYTRGPVIATSRSVLVDVSGPVLTVVTTPDYFSPDNDGEDDELFIHITATDASPIASWRMEIREPEPPYLLFRVFEGQGIPARRIVWDGRSDRGELVQSATDYPFTVTATDILGNSTTVEGKIGVDVLVIRDGDRLRIMIPSIVFRPNFADFQGLDSDVVDNNARIIRRIAQILNKFRDYRVLVEGHANPTSAPGTPERTREEAELQRISEARARAIVDQLVRNGVARNRLSAAGAGGSNPVVPYEDRDNWWKNRRVEFILIK
jgi:outer membrane protein OmpA-like peptidoglycan-associated protein/flagellar hook assembly protein FlgD